MSSGGPPPVFIARKRAAIVWGQSIQRSMADVRVGMGTDFVYSEHSEHKKTKLIRSEHLVFAEHALSSF